MRLNRTFLVLHLSALLASTAVYAQPATSASTPSTTTAMMTPPTAPNPGVPMPSVPNAQLPPLPVLSAEAAETEAQRLQAELARAVPHRLVLSPRQQQLLIAEAQNTAALSDKLVLNRPQLVVVVDRNPRMQMLMIVLAQPDGPWKLIGGTHVSTGQAGRKYYYITPTGVFAHDGSVLDYRAEGTFNENHIRGLGLKGSRVWDFGWQWAEKGWPGNGMQGQIRMEMHATDPQYLEQRIGRPASEGCIRIPAALNRFLDKMGVLDANYEQEAAQEARVRAVLLRDRTPTPVAGNTFIVIDSDLSG